MLVGRGNPWACTWVPFGLSPVLNDVREHRFRHTLVAQHSVIIGVSAPRRQVQTALEPAFCCSSHILLGLS